MNRLHLLLVVPLAALTLTAAAQSRRPPSSAPPFTVVEATIPEMQAAMKEGRINSRQLVQEYLMRIAMYEDTLHAALTVNRDALREADARDRERVQGRVRGPLHGIPVALKDNMHT